MYTRFEPGIIGWSLARAYWIFLRKESVLRNARQVFTCFYERMIRVRAWNNRVRDKIRRDSPRDTARIYFSPVFQSKYIFRCAKRDKEVERGREREGYKRERRDI